MPQHTQKRRRWPIVLVALLALLLVGYLSKNVLLAQAWFWSFQIRSYEKADKQHPPRPGQILFIGSSSIRYWKTLKRDFAPLPVHNRGFGGAHVPHVSHYADRILFPYKPRIIVLYVGENDLAAGSSPQKVHADLDALLDQIRKRLPHTHVYYLSVKPSVLRASAWPVMAAFNTHIQKKLKSRPHVTYVDVSSKMLLPKGKAKPSLFSWDRLHMNAKGYKLWTQILKPILLQAWKANTPQPSTHPTSQPSP